MQEKSNTRSIIDRSAITCYKIPMQHPVKIALVLIANDDHNFELMVAFMYARTAQNSVTDTKSDFEKQSVKHFNNWWKMGA